MTVLVRRDASRPQSGDLSPHSRNHGKYTILILEPLELAQHDLVAWS